MGKCRQHHACLQVYVMSTEDARRNSTPVSGPCLGRNSCRKFGSPLLNRCVCIRAILTCKFPSSPPRWVRCSCLGLCEPIIIANFTSSSETFCPSLLQPPLPNGMPVPLVATSLRSDDVLAWPSPNLKGLQQAPVPPRSSSYVRRPHLQVSLGH